jgi:catechol 2,3-dioxygenase-like lactoylglutathione lyase family enzyme
VTHPTDAQRAELARHYARIGYVEGELWPAPPGNLEPADVIALLKTVPDGAGREGYIAALATGGKPAPAINLVFVAGNELALHVADPAKAEKFYTQELGCAVVSRGPRGATLTNGALKFCIVGDPVPAVNAVIPCFSVTNRAAALTRLQSAGCALVRIGPNTPAKTYVKDPNGIVFELVERVPG